MTEIILDSNEDWEKRILCSDESCIGVIGEDGSCKECGKVYEGNLAGQKTTGDVPSKISEEQKTGASTDAPSEDDWDQRILCGDEACIGVIGSDGKCKECGKPL